MGFLGDIGNFATGAVSGGLTGLGLGPLGNAIGGGNFIPDLLTGGAVSNAQAQMDANSKNVELAQHQMDFQERMSGSAYQRAMADMGKAGLNPMLAFSQGGASSPSGAAATMQPVNKGDIAGNLGTTAMQLAGLNADLKNKFSQVEVNNSQLGVNDASAAKLTANAQESQQNSEYLGEQTKKVKHQIREAQASADTAVMERDVQKARQATDVKAAPYNSIIDSVKNALGAISSGFGLFKSSKGGSDHYGSGYQKGLDRGVRMGTPVP